MELYVFDSLKDPVLKSHLAINWTKLVVGHYHTDNMCAANYL